jgi:ketosteroid isomerase-like protein
VTDAKGHSRAAMKSVVTEVLAAVSRLDAEGLRPWLAADVAMEFPYAPPGLTATYTGIEQVVWAMGVLPQLYTRFEWTMTECLASPVTDTLIVRAESDAELIGGTPRRNNYVIVFRFRAHQVVLWREYFNSLKL